MAAVTFADLITFSRGSHAMETDATGKLTYAPNNLILNSAAFSTQSVTVQPIAYILSFKGTGTITLSGTSTAGPLVGTGVGDRVYLKFTPTAGSLTLTESGTTTEAQLEAVTYQTVPRDYNATTASAYYGARIDHDVNGNAIGLLIEEARTNQALFSEKFDNAAHIKDNAPITADAVAAPDGQTAADLATDNTTNDIHRIYIGGLTFGAPATHSVFGKAGAASWFQMQILNATNFIGNVNLTTGAIGFTEALTGSVTARIEQAYNGFYRSSITSSVSGASGSCQLAFTANTDSHATIPGYVGTTIGAYFWGQQIEVGAFPTSYIPAFATATTRNADIAAITGTDFTDWWDATKGTMVVTARTPASGTRPILSFDNDTTNEQIRLYTSGTDLKLTITDGGSTVADLTIGTIVANTEFKVAFRYAANNVAASLNGATAVSDTVVTLPTVDRCRLGSDKAGNYLCGHIARVRRHAGVVPNQILQDLAA